MSVLQHIELAILGIALAAAAAFGAAVAYHFFRYSPDPKVSTMTVGVYVAGVILIVGCAFVAILLT